MFALIAAGATTAVSAAGTILTIAEIVSATGSLMVAVQPLMDCIQNIKKHKDED